MRNYSQNNEQEILLKYIQHTNLTKGRLLDIGAYDGETFSNVREILLQYPDWSGVLVEPSSYCFTKLVDMYKMEPRRVNLINAAVIPENQVDGEPLLEFYDSPMSAASSTMQDWVENGIGDKVERNADGDVVNPRKVYVGKIGMKKLLDSFGPFDFINIDVEGYSATLALQEWFDPRNYGCKVICVEQDGHGGQIHPDLVKKFGSMGYKILGVTWENLIMAS